MVVNGGGEIIKKFDIFFTRLNIDIAK